jgi:uncharacterized protein
MPHRCAAVSLAIVVAVGVAALMPARSPLRAQSADLVLCDRLAADPDDPDKPPGVPGVAEVAAADVPTAIKFCKVATAAKAAPATTRRALYQLGRAYTSGGQFNEAMSVYRKAADKGSTAAMVALGLMYARGAGVAQDQAQAGEWLQRAANAGNARAATELVALATHSGTPLDPAQARMLLARAAETNSAEAEYQLGVMNADGVGGPKDDVAARALFEKAAAQGHAKALERMGAFALNGRGGPQDDAAAKAYYEKAAALGNEDAKAALKKLDCPYVVRDKKGNIVSRLCF